MISKLKIGQNATGALKYDIEKEKAEVLYKNNIFGETAEEMGAEMRAVSDQRSMKNNTFHISLSLDKERATGEQWKLAADAYMVKMGFDLTKAQFVVTRHNDTQHDHIHITCNRVQLDGSVISDSKTFERSHSATRAAEIASGLQIFQKSEEMGNDGKMANLRSTIKTALYSSKTYDEFKTALKNSSIEIIENKSKTSGHISGISYKIEASGQTWKGSAVGKEFSYSNINKTLGNELNAENSKSGAKQAQKSGRSQSPAQNTAANVGAATQARVDAQRGKKDSEISKAKNSASEDEQKRLQAIKQAEQQDEDEMWFNLSYSNINMLTG